jgi:TetR/AcrR family transcriptional regulator, repressor for uid operon
MDICMRTANPELQSRRRFEIVSAAEQCFLKRGFHQTSMQNIASESGLSMGLLYRYFSNKEAIIEAVAQRDQEMTLAAIADLPAQGDVIAAWVSLLIDGSNLASAPDYAALASEILAEANRSPKIHKMLQNNEAALAAAIAGKLGEQANADAIYLPSDAQSAAQSLLLLFDGLTMRKLSSLPALHQAIEHSVERMVQSIFESNDQ